MRERLGTVAQETIGILKSGGYQLPGGGQVRLAADIARAVAGTRLTLRQDQRTRPGTAARRHRRAKLAPRRGNRRQTAPWPQRHRSRRPGGPQIAAACRAAPPRRPGPASPGPAPEAGPAGPADLSLRAYGHGQECGRTAPSSVPQTPSPAASSRPEPAGTFAARRPASASALAGGHGDSGDEADAGSGLARPRRVHRGRFLRGGSMARSGRQVVFVSGAPGHARPPCPSRWPPSRDSHWCARTRIKETLQDGLGAPRCPAW
jgi:hypothetical protein